MNDLIKKACSLSSQQSYLLKNPAAVVLTGNDQPDAAIVCEDWQADEAVLFDQ